jgi:polar amino acid transport system substrate-binding protein
MPLVPSVRSILVASCLAVAAVGAAHADLLDDIMKAKKIRIATDVAIPPAGMMDANMQPIGSDVETAKLLAKDWGLKLEFVQTTGATRIPNVNTGKADIIISTLSVTPDRAKVIDFSKPYAVLQSVVGAPKSAAIKDWADLKGKSVTVTRGTTQDTELTGMANDKGFKVVRYDDDATMVTSGVSGQAEMVATSVALVNAISAKSTKGAWEPKFVIRNFDLAIGIKKGEPRLLAKLDQWVSANLKNGKLSDIYKKYYGVALPAAMQQ